MKERENNLKKEKVIYDVYKKAKADPNSKPRHINAGKSSTNDESTGTYSYHSESLFQKESSPKKKSSKANTSKSKGKKTAPKPLI